MDILQAGVGPSRRFATSSATAATATASFAATTAQCWVLDGCDLTWSLIPASSATLTIADGGTVIWRGFVSTSATAPLHVYGPLVMTVGNSCVAQCTSLGSGVTGSISLRGKLLYP